MRIGSVDGLTPLDEEKEKLSLRRKAQKYAREFVEALKNGDVHQPSLGDCFFCQMREVKTGVPLGECSHDQTHILSHIEEKYFVATGRSDPVPGGSDSRCGPVPFHGVL